MTHVHHRAHGHGHRHGGNGDPLGGLKQGNGDLAKFLRDSSPRERWPRVMAILEKDLLTSHITVGNMAKVAMLILVLSVLFALFFLFAGFGDPAKGGNGFIADRAFVPDPIIMLFIFAFILYLVPQTFRMGISQEEKTFRVLRLYPIGLNGLLSAKLLYCFILSFLIGALVFVWWQIPFVLLGVMAPGFFIDTLVMVLVVMPLVFLTVVAGAYFANGLAQRGERPWTISSAFGMVLLSLIFTSPCIGAICRGLAEISASIRGTYVGTSDYANIHTATYVLSHLSPLQLAYNTCDSVLTGAAFDYTFLLVLFLGAPMLAWGAVKGSRIYLDVFK